MPTSMELNHPLMSLSLPRCQHPHQALFLCFIHTESISSRNQHFHQKRKSHLQKLWKNSKKDTNQHLGTRMQRFRDQSDMLALSVVNDSSFCF